MKAHSTLEYIPALGGPSSWVLFVLKYSHPYTICDRASSIACISCNTYICCLLLYFPKRLARLEGLFLFHSLLSTALFRAHSTPRSGTSPKIEDVLRGRSQKKFFVNTYIYSPRPERRPKRQGRQPGSPLFLHSMLDRNAYYQRSISAQGSEMELALESGRARNSPQSITELRQANAAGDLQWPNWLRRKRRN